MEPAPAIGRRSLSPVRLAVLGLLALAGSAGFGALGVWQLQRLGWKRTLIERVETRAHAAPVASPGPELWPEIAGDEYRRVTLSGHFLNDRETLVQAVTERGGGYWVMTPFRTDRGFTVLVNRGFVPPERRDPATRLAGQVQDKTTATGLLRLSEPKGGFLRDNEPATGRWHSRDVTAIAAARGLETAAPYFVDADATPNPGGSPLGGLTVLRFSDNHLGYALTWFALALMTAGTGAFVVTSDLRRRDRDAETVERDRLHLTGPAAR